MLYGYVDLLRLITRAMILTVVDGRPASPQRLSVASDERCSVATSFFGGLSPSFLSVAYRYSGSFAVSSCGAKYVEIKPGSDVQM
jgi:hypothetical protein